jgi:hypothetical protein
MAPQIASFDHYELQRAKQVARVEDDVRLAFDPMARAELERRNGMFSAFDPSQMRIGRRRVPLRKS